MSRITGSEVKSLMEAYSEVYEQKDEIIFEQQPANQSVLSKKTINGKQIEGSGVGKDFRAGEWSDEAKRRYAQVKSKDTLYGRYQTPDTQKRFDKPKVDEPDASDSNTDDKGQLPPTRPAAPVLSKKGGVEGTGVGKDFKAKSWSDTEKQRYTSASAKVAPTKPALGPTGKPLVGGIERRTPTRAEMGAAKAYRTPAATTGTLGAATVVASKPAAFGSTSTAPAVSPTPVAKTTPTPVTPKPNLQQTIRANRGLAPIRSSYEYDAYDLVLEYLLSQGHTDTVEEAHYIMLEMDTETVGSIIEAAADQSDKQIDKGVKSTYKAQNVLDNQHQGRSKGLNKLPRGEREEKVKRMRGRLKSRRDDLFGERNKREDSKREQLKKMLGL